MCATRAKSSVREHVTLKRRHLALSLPQDVRASVGVPRSRRHDDEVREPASIEQSARDLVMRRTRDNEVVGDAISSESMFPYRLPQQLLEFMKLHPTTNRQFDGSQDFLCGVSRELSEVDRQRPQGVWFVLQAQPFRKADRLSDPHLVHEFPVLERCDAFFGSEVREPQTTEMRVGDHWLMGRARIAIQWTVSTGRVLVTGTLRPRFRPRQARGSPPRTLRWALERSGRQQSCKDAPPGDRQRVEDADIRVCMAILPSA